MLAAAPETTYRQAQEDRRRGLPTVDDARWSRLDDGGDDEGRSTVQAGNSIK